MVSCFTPSTVAVSFSTNSSFSLFYNPFVSHPQARIKAINTFFAKNGYRSMDSSMYAHQTQTQSQYSSPLYMQPVYPQQQYPVYGIVPPTWTTSQIGRASFRETV